MEFVAIDCLTKLHRGEAVDSVKEWAHERVKALKPDPDAKDLD